MILMSGMIVERDVTILFSVLEGEGCNGITGNGVIYGALLVMRSVCMFVCPWADASVSSQNGVAFSIIFN